MHIVELYGLPGSGKTTLRDMLIEDKSIENYRSIISVGDEYKRKGIMMKIAHLPISVWFTLFRLFFALPFLPMKEWEKYRHLFVVTLLYSYASRAEANSYVIIDHGIVQDVVGILYGRVKIVSPMVIQLLCTLVKKLQVSHICYCAIGVDVAKKRIRIRNRQGVGRLDSINDDNVLTEELSVQETMFAKIYDALSLIEGVDNSKLIMTKEPSQIKETVLQII